MTRLPTIKGFFLVVVFGVLLVLSPRQAHADVITDLDPPVMSISSSCPSTCSGSNTATFTLSCTDTGGSGCDSSTYQYKIDSGSWTTYNPASKPSVSASASTQTIYARGSDLVGNASAEASYAQTFRLYTISGNIYMDVNDSNTYNSGTDTTFTESVTVHASGQSDIVTSSGAFSFTNLTSGSYTISIDTPTGYSSTAALKSQPVTVNFSNGDTSDANFLVRGFSVSGNVYLDYDHNAIYDPSWDTNLSGATIALSAGYTTRSDTTTDASGNYSFVGLKGGSTTYTVTASKSGYNFTYTSAPADPRTGVQIGPSTTVSFSAAPTYTFSGNIYLDRNKAKYRGAQGLFTTSSTFKLVDSHTDCAGSAVATTTTTTGSYSFPNLLSGEYKVCYTSLQNPPYEMTYPVVSTPDYLIASVGYHTAITPTAPSGYPATYHICNIYSNHDASCDGSGNATNVNFGITDSFPWLQACGLDLRTDGGINNRVPSTSACGAYTMVNCPTNSNSSGIFFTGDGSSSFGESTGNAPSASGWIVGGSSGGNYTETFSPVNGRVIRTSFSYFLTTARQSGVTLTDLTSYCGGGGLASCSLSTSLPNGVYLADGNLTLAASDYTFPSNKNFVILVNGNLTIQGRIAVPVGSTATWSVKGDITVTSGVGQSTAQCNPDPTGTGATACDLQGFFSADSDIVVQGVNDCTSSSDRQLSVCGSMVANGAGLTGGSAGSFQYSRDLCGNDRNYPTVVFQQRNDFLLNAPDLIKSPTFVWQEVAP